MGLYDNYKLANSNLVESFAGSTVPELTKMKDSLDNRYEIAKEKISGLEDMLVEAPILEADKQNWVNINNEAQVKIGELSKRPDLENTVLDVHTYSAKVANKLKSLALQKKTRDEYYGALDKMDLPNDVKDMYKQESDQKYGGLKFDEYGKATNSYVGDTPTKNVDTPEKIRKALQILISSGDVQSYTQDSENGMYTIQTTNGIERRTANEVLGAVRAAQKLDLEWQASDNQAVRAEVFHNTKNVTDATVQQFLDRETSNTGEQLKQQEIKRLVGDGMSLKDAYKTVQTDQAIKNKQDALERYALGNMYSKTSSTKVVQEGPEAQAQRQRDMVDYTQKKQYEYALKQAEEVAKLAPKTTEEKDKDINEFRVVGPMATLNVPNWAPTIKALQENGISKEEKNLEELNISLKNKQAQLQAAQTSGDQRAQTTLSAEISAISSKIKGSTNSVQMYKTIEKQALDEATREANITNNKESVTTYAQLQKIVVPRVYKALEASGYPKVVNATNTKGQSVTLTREQIGKALASGNVKGTLSSTPLEPDANGNINLPENKLVETSGFNRPRLTSYVVNIDGKQYLLPTNADQGIMFNSKVQNIFKGTTELVHIKAKEKSTKNFSIQDKGVTLTPKEREVILFSDAIVGYVDNDGVTPKEKPIGYDPTKTVIGGTMGEMTGLVPVQYRDKDNNLLSSGYITTTGTEIQNFIGERMSRSPQEVVRNIGLQWMYKDNEDTKKLFPGNKIDVGNDGKPILYWNGTKTIPVIIDVTSEGVGSIVDKATGQVIVIKGKKQENLPTSTLQQILTVSKFQQ
jgi:hypothetical protein